jgi:glutamine amidotransferase
VQSTNHKDGWGVAYYVGGSPHLVKSAASAMEDAIFQRVSGVVASETVVAHVRAATQGELNPLNSHPFQHGRWIFAHNGNLANFAEHRPAVIARIAPSLRRYVLGTTDSEVLFYLLLSKLQARGPLHTRHFHIDELAAAAQEAVADVCTVVGKLCGDAAGPPTASYLTFLLTDGQLMLAHQGGKPLYVSTWKHLCPERDTCASFAAECEAKTQSGFVNHLILSSEVLQGENVWLALKPADMIGVDGSMRLHEYAGDTEVYS